MRGGAEVDGPIRMVIRVDDTDVDPRELDVLAGRLRDELTATVDGVTAGEAPPGAKSIELAAVGALMLTLAQSPVLAAVIDAISAWLGQRRQRTVRLELGGDVLELSGQPSREQQRIVDAWLQRHRAEIDGGPIGGRYALIVASYDYLDPGLRQLRAPAHDAEQLARVLGDPSIGGFTVQTMRNGAASEVNEAVEDFFADRNPNDLLLLYFSGHGVKDEDGELYFAAASTKLNRLGATAVAADFVNRRMSRSRSRRIVLLLDCCYAGAFGRGMVARAGSDIPIKEQFGGHGRAVITATSGMEYAFEGQQLADTHEGRPSVFTTALVEGLDTGDADRDQDGYVGLDELYDYVYERVRRLTPNQTPGKWVFDLRGDLYLARRSRPVTTPAALPRELQVAIENPLTGVRAGAVEELGRLLRGRHEGLALAARLALRHLLDDDSRTVSAAAAAILGPAPPPSTAPTVPAAQTVPAAPTARGRYHVTPLSVTDKPQAPPKTFVMPDAMTWNFVLSALPLLLGLCIGLLAPIIWLGYFALALPAVVYGAKARKLVVAGDMSGARAALRRARIWSIACFVVCVLVGVAVAVLDDL